MPELGDDATCLSSAANAVFLAEAWFLDLAPPLRHPVYAGAYVLGRTTQRTQVVDGRARRTTGRSKPMTAWNVLLRDHHPGYITWEQFEEN
jgi:hypothetical protein